MERVSLWPVRTRSLNPPSHQRFRRRRWSVHGAYRAQPVATGGKCASLGNGSNKPKPLPPVATSCRSERMVRRGSTVRVRQRASGFRMLSCRCRCPRWRRQRAVASTQRPPASTVAEGAFDHVAGAVGGSVVGDWAGSGFRSWAQLTAFFTSAAIFASSAAVNSFSAKATGHRAPLSRFAASLKPNVAYLDLNFCALWK